MTAVLYAFAIFAAYWYFGFWVALAVAMAIPLAIIGTFAIVAALMERYL